MAGDAVLRWSCGEAVRPGEKYREHVQRCLASEDPGVRAHRLSTEVVRRWTSGKVLGTPSLYNVVREVLVEEFDRSTPVDNPSAEA